MAVNSEQAELVIRDFYNEFPSIIGHLHIGYRDTQEEYYGDKGSVENVGGKIKGAFLPRSKEVHLPLASFRDTGDLRESIQHEVLGHFGLLTFNGHDKRALLEVINSSRDSPSLRAGWAWIDREYASLSELMKAEELFCLFAETVQGDYKMASAEFDKTWATVVANRERPLQRNDLLVIAMTVADGIQCGSRSQQIFPENDFSQFQRLAEQGPKNGRFVGIVLDVSNGIVKQKIGRGGEVALHVQDSLTAVVTPGQLLDICYKDGVGVILDTEPSVGLAR